MNQETGTGWGFPFPFPPLSPNSKYWRPNRVWFICPKVGVCSYQQTQPQTSLGQVYVAELVDNRGRCRQAFASVMKLSTGIPCFTACRFMCFTVLVFLFVCFVLFFDFLTNQRQDPPPAQITTHFIVIPNLLQWSGTELQYVWGVPVLWSVKAHFSHVLSHYGKHQGPVDKTQLSDLGLVSLCSP